MFCWRSGDEPEGLGLGRGREKRRSQEACELVGEACWSLGLRWSKEQEKWGYIRNVSAIYSRWEHGKGGQGRLKQIFCCRVKGEMGGLCLGVLIAFNKKTTVERIVWDGNIQLGKVHLLVTRHRKLGSLFKMIYSILSYLHSIPPTPHMSSQHVPFSTPFHGVCVCVWFCICVSWHVCGVELH